MSIGILVTHLSELAWTLLVGNIICVSYVMLQKTWNLDGYCWWVICICIEEFWDLHRGNMYLLCKSTRSL